MLLIPAFKIGIWNAWIFMLYLILSFPFFIRIAIKLGVPPADESELSMGGKVVVYSSKLILIPALVYSIFLPLKLGTIWFYIGLPITLIGLITYTIVLVNWATTSPNAPITRGLYRFSRHPMYITIFIFFLGLGIASASWIFFLFGIVFVVGCFAFINVEEQGCLQKYGDSYREYMNRTPRWIRIPKSVAK